MNLTTDVANIKTDQQIDALIDEYYNFINQPLDYMVEKNGERYTEEEEEQILRILMIYKILYQSTLEEALDRMLKYWIGRTEEALRSKMMGIKKKYKMELMIFKMIAPTIYIDYSNDVISKANVTNSDVYTSIKRHFENIEGLLHI